MKVIWNEKEKKKIRKFQKDKRYWLKIWRLLNWYKLRFPELIKEMEEAIGE